MGYFAGGIPELEGVLAGLCASGHDTGRSRTLLHFCGIRTRLG